MARLIDWPVGLSANFREPLTGPRTVGAGSSQSMSGWVQTTAAPFGMWRWRFQFPPLRGQAFRRYRGWVTALHGGANATRVPMCDWDGLSFAQRGIAETSDFVRSGRPWSHGLPWSNGKNWRVGSPSISVAQAATKGATIIQLGADFWGRNLDYGDFIGFFPFHFGLYMITERIDEEGKYRIWPPLRKALTAADFATLKPTLAMRLESEDAANAPREAAFAEGLAVTLVEVLDADVRNYFAE